METTMFIMQILLYALILLGVLVFIFYKIFTIIKKKKQGEDVSEDIDELIDNAGGILTNVTDKVNDIIEDKSTQMDNNKNLENKNDS